HCCAPLIPLRLLAAFPAGLRPRRFCFTASTNTSGGDDMSIVEHLQLPDERQPTLEEVLALLRAWSAADAHWRKLSDAKYAAEQEYEKQHGDSNQAWQALHDLEQRLFALV